MRKTDAELAELGRTAIKIACTEFYYWGHNQPGGHTGKGFDSWMNTMNGKWNVAAIVSAIATAVREESAEEIKRLEQMLGVMQSHLDDECGECTARQEGIQEGMRQAAARISEMMGDEDATDGLGVYEVLETLLESFTTPSLDKRDDAT